MIPVEAVEAAAKALRTTPLDGVASWRDIAQTALEAAAPHMLAECWDAAIEAHKAWTWDDENMDPLANPYRPTP